MKKALFDTSVWIKHFRVPDERLIAALEDDSIVIHEAIIGELAVGRIPKPKSTIPDLLLLPRAPNVAFDETIFFLQRQKLVSKGLSWIDVQLLASAMSADLQLYTYDLPLAAAWKKLST